MNLTLVVLLGLLLLIAEPAMALRCGGKIVNKGTPQAKVLRYCGEPTGVQIRSIYRSGFPRTQIRHSVQPSGTARHDQELLFADRSTVEVIVEEWTYNFGPRKLMRKIRFENGIVTSIEQLGYGYHER